MSRVIQIRKKGLVTLPKEFRRRYRLEEGDPLTVIDLGEELFLSPKRAVIPKLVAEIEAIRQKYNVSLEELIQGVAEQRSKYLNR